MKTARTFTTTEVKDAQGNIITEAGNWRVQVEQLTFLRNKEIHILVQKVDLSDFTVTNHVFIVEKQNLGNIFNKALNSGDSFGLALDNLLWQFIENNHKNELILGRNPLLDEVVPDWTPAT